MKKLILDNKEYTSRFILGTGKYKDFEETQSAIEVSGCEMVTVAIRRMNIGQDQNSKNLLDYISQKKYTILPNTAGCFNAQDAIRTCNIAAEILNGEKLVKLEVLGDKKTLYPNEVENVISSHPKVLEVGVIGVSDRRTGEAVNVEEKYIPRFKTGKELRLKLNKQENSTNES